MRAVMRLMLGSPPHTRGILPKKNAEKVNPEVHPRIRGEYLGDFGQPGTPEGSPPHTRGIRRACDDLKIYLGFTPAYAGNTTTRTVSHL